MAPCKITKTSVDALNPDPRRDVYLWDSLVPGFGVKVTPAGGRTYLLQYRNRMRVTRRVTIGRHGQPWTPEKARKEADRLHRQVRTGVDPAADISERKKQSPFRDALELFLTDQIGARRKQRTATEYRRLLDIHAEPVFGATAINSIKRPAIARLHQKMKATPYQANRVLAALGSMFSWAIRHGHYQGDNPCRYVEKYAERKRERFLSPRELASIGATLARHESENAVAVAAIRFLLLTGMRKSEVLNVTWGEVDHAGGCLRLKDSKTGAKTVPLSAPALEVLAAAENFRSARNPHVFPGQVDGKPLVGLQKIWERWRDETTVDMWSADPKLKAVIAEAKKASGLLGPITADAVTAAAGKLGVQLPRGVRDVRVHDFRHSFASVGASAGDSLVILGSILGHASTATTARYAHLYEDPRKAAAERIAGQIAATMRGGAGGEIINLRPARGA